MKGKMKTSLILILFVTLSTRAEESISGETLIDGVKPQPSGYSCFSPEDIGHLATYKKTCDVCKYDLRATKSTLQNCIDHGAPATKWWADPNIVIGGFAISLSLGVMLGVMLDKR